MSQDPFNWQAFLGCWQEEWVPREDVDEEGGQSVVLPGKPGAGEAVIAGAEERLGRRLPPSYREFLAVSDGWHVDQPAGIYQLGGAADIDWFEDPYDMTSLYEEGLGDDPRREEVLLAGMWRRALRLETDSDMSHALLDPGDRDQDGEWALYVYRGWGGESPERYPSFRAYMEAMYRSFHADRVAKAGFVNATTRAQDAHVEEGRLLALRGQYEEALSLLGEALSFGRPGSWVLLGQLRQLLAQRGFHGYGNLVADPDYLPELLPAEALVSAQRGRRADWDDHWLTMMIARGVARETAEAVQRGMREGTHRYAPPGRWGRAVAEAWELARWGATDRAWRVLRNALPLWEAPGPLLVAPVGLLADPVLGPLVTPERGRELLATARAGEKGTTPDRVPDMDPPGLAWLAEPARGSRAVEAFRCVWVEGAHPEDLPGLIGEEGGAGLSAPVHAWDERFRLRREQERERDDVEHWEDQALTAAGLTHEGWAFAYEGQRATSIADRLVSPAIAASRESRAVMVCYQPAWQSGNPAAVFHLSVAQGGVESYAFTVNGTEIEQRSGTIPEALDPMLLCESEDHGGALRAMLEALSGELGLSLPRFALTEGRLPVFTTRSWSRAPRAGEAYVTLSFGRHRS